MIPEVDKKKLVLVHNKTDKIDEVELKTKKIGYYKDSWIRFKKNKASLTAFIIICIIMLFVIIGPYLKNYKLYTENKTEAARIANLPPKIPGLEKLGIFNGYKTIERDKIFLVHLANSEEGKGIIKTKIDEEMLKNPNADKFKNISSLTVKVDYYKYIDYIKSYIPEDYFGTINSNKKQGAQQRDPYGTVRRSLIQEEFEEHLKKGNIVDILKINKTLDSTTGKTSITYEVRMHQFKASLNTLPEDTYFWFGTTAAGQDLFTELWKGARISLLMAVLVILINTTIGLTIGAIVGYYGNLLDLLFGRLVEIISSIPFLSVLTLLTLRFGSPIWVIILAFTATGWIGSYGTGRVQFYRFKNREYVLAARTLGASDKRIMFKHIFPNTLGYIVTGYALAIPAFVFTEATYSFLNIIQYSDATSVGFLIQQGQSNMVQTPHLLLFPAIYIAILMISFNLFGNGLRDAFNPSLRGAE